MGFGPCPERGHEGRTREVPQEDHCSSMNIDHYELSYCIFMYSRLFDYSVFDYLSLLFLHVGNLICNAN
jgi:hypothetical protein